MRILGVDPGTLRTGWGIVEKAAGGRARGIEAGVVRMKSEQPLATRLLCVYEALLQLIDRHQPQAMAVEDIFFAKYANAALKLGHVRGVVLLAAAARSLQLHELPPALVKRCVAGDGRASKEQVGRMVGAMLGWRELPTVDATDALAVALTQLAAAGLPPGLPALAFRA